MPPASIMTSLSFSVFNIKPPNGPNTLTLSPGMMSWMAVVNRPCTFMLNSKTSWSVGELTIEKHLAGVGFPL